MAVFNQSMRGGNISTFIDIQPVSHIKDLNFSCAVKINRERKKKDLINKINKLIDDFNDLNKYLATTFLWDNYNNSYSFAKAQEKAFASKGLATHRNYLLAFEHEACFNIQKLLDRLYYNRTKDFEDFLKSLEGKSVVSIGLRIAMWRAKNFRRYKHDAQKAILEQSIAVLSRVIKKDLKQKQKSRQKQLLDKFRVWKKKLSNPKNDKQKAFAGAVNSLVAILSGNGKNLSKDEVSILKDCFGKNRNWVTAWGKRMVQKYNPFPGLNDLTNRVIIMLYGIITDNGSNLDAIISAYLS